MIDLTNPELLNTADGQPELNPEFKPELLASADVQISNEIMDATDEDLEDAVTEDVLDFSQLSKQELIAAARHTIENLNPEEAIKRLREIKPFLDAAWLAESEEALASFLAEGGLKEDFVYSHAETEKDQFATWLKQAKQKRDEEKAKQDAEREANYQAKLNLLEAIKQLTEEDETEGSFSKFKELQSQFKSIRNIAKEKNEEIWNTFKIYEHRFFDRLSINNELKDLDRKKNLGAKIELIEKVSKLSEDIKSKRALISLKKYQEEWRNIGPVPREANEDIWNRFKSESDKVYDLIKAYHAEQDKIREENLERKKALLAKALELSNFQSNKTKDWVAQTTVANQLMEDWKQIGMVPLKFKDSIWDEFRQSRNEFFANKNQFFKLLNAERNKSLQVKNELCEKAEQIAANPIDWAKQTEAIKQLQEQWKKSGAVHEKVTDVIWKRFRTACDLFFEKKAQHFAAQVDEQKQNLEIKSQLIRELEALLEKPENEQLISELKRIQEQWNKSGYVPLQEKERINKRYNELNEHVFSKFKEASEAMRELREKSHWEALLLSPNGQQKMKREEKILIERIKGLRNDIDTWENNLGFFGKSNKGENPMIKQVEEKIAIARKNVTQLEDKLKNMRVFIKQHAPGSSN